MKTKEEVLSILKIHPNGNIEEPQFKKKFPEHYQILSTWEFPSDFKFTQKLFHYFNDDPELKLGLCPVCGKRCKFASFGGGYLLHCSVKCKNLDPNTQLHREQTFIKKFGHKTSFMNEDVKEKIRNTLKERYGAEHALQVNEFKQKAKETTIERYGTEYYTQTNEYRQRYIDTCQKIYGTNNVFQNEEIKKKIQQTNLKKYGVKHYTQTQECLDKMQKTCQERYGVINYSQTKEWSHKKKKRILFDGIYFDSSWEVIVFKYCKINNIPCEYQPNITFEYTYDNNIHHYHPDFLIDGKLYEVKGEQFFDGDKMICPYNRNEYLDKMAESKHQCMIKNGIIILRSDDIKKIKERI